MSALAPTLQAFFTDRLTRQRQASPHTIASYRDTMRLLLTFAQRHAGKQPCRLDLDDLDAPLIGAFLDHLEHERHNSVRHPQRTTRGDPLAVPLRRATPPRAFSAHPTGARDPTQALRPRHHHLPHRSRGQRPDCCARPSHLDRQTRPRLLLLATQTGLRVSELTSLNCGDVHLGSGAHLSCIGKGRKQRITPLTAATNAVLRVWLTERAGWPEDPLFPTSRGGRLSRDAVERRLAKHQASATHNCRSLTEKRITPHVLRHTAAMRLLHAGIDTSVIALWLGHENVETTQIYLHADLTLKEQALGAP